VSRGGGVASSSSSSSFAGGSGSYAPSSSSFSSSFAPASSDPSSSSSSSSMSAAERALLADLKAAGIPYDAPAAAAAQPARAGGDGLAAGAASAAGGAALQSASAAGFPSSSDSTNPSNAELLNRLLDPAPFAAAATTGATIFGDAMRLTAGIVAGAAATAVERLRDGPRGAGGGLSSLSSGLPATPGHLSRTPADKASFFGRGGRWGGDGDRAVAAALWGGGDAAASSGGGAGAGSGGGGGGGSLGPVQSSDHGGMRGLTLSTFTGAGALSAGAARGMLNPAQLRGEGAGGAAGDGATSGGGISFGPLQPAVDSLQRGLTLVLLPLAVLVRMALYVVGGLLKCVGCARAGSFARRVGSAATPGTVGVVAALLLGLYLAYAYANAQGWGPGDEGGSVWSSSSSSSGSTRELEGGKGAEGEGEGKGGGGEGGGEQAGK
jgi:hypothetical protein